MIRMVLALIIFTLTVRTLIVHEPFQPLDQAEASTEPERIEVTRAAPPEPGFIAPVNPPVPPARETTDTGRQDLPDTLAAAPGTTTAAAAPVRADEVAATMPDEPRHEPGAARVPTTPQVEARLEGLVTAALRQGASDAYVARLVNEARQAREIETPGVPVTIAGVPADPAPLRSAIAPKDAAIGPTPAGLTTPAALDAEATGAVPAIAKDVVYTVQPGDSLGALAWRFYGNADFYRRIFDANQQVLADPDLIQSGQRLVIPAP